MSFRNDKIRGNHPITPKKGISERKLGKNSDRIQIVKLGHDIDFSKTKELAGKIDDPTGKILSEFNAYVHEVKGDKELSDYERNELQSKFFGKKLSRLYQDTWNDDDGTLKKKVVELNKVFKDIYGHPFLDEKYMHTGDKYDLIYAIRDVTKSIESSLPYGNAFDKKIMEHRNFGLKISVNFHKQDRAARHVIEENKEIAKKVWNGLTQEQRHGFTRMHIGYSEPYVASYAAERVWDGRMSDNMIVESLIDIIRESNEHPQRFTPEFRMKVKPLIDVSREKFEKAVVK